MLDALAIFYIYTAAGIWRYFNQNYLETGKYQEKWEKLNPWLRMLSHYYTIAFLGFLWLLKDNVIATLECLNTFGLIDPSRFLLTAEGLEQTRCPNGTQLPPLNWTADERDQVRFDQQGWMRMLVIGSCPAVVLTQMIGWTQIGRHWLRIKNSESVRLSGVDGHELRDRAIKIMFLPVIYSVVAYNNVIRLMNLFSGIIDFCRPEWYLGFDEKAAYTSTLYEANLAMADFYEAIALLQFTKLAVHHIKVYFRRGSKTPEKGSLARVDTSKLEKSDPVLKVTKVMTSLVMSGVMSFVVTCFLSFAKGLYLVFYMAFYKQVVSVAGSLPSMLSGAGLVASTVAISNVVNVEVEFHEELHLFNPGAKFWSTKIIVSIAFIQEFLLGLLGSYGPKLSELQINLLYCSLLCYEVLLVALLHVWAWPPSVDITVEEKKRHNNKNPGDTEYWEEAVHHHPVEAREPLLCIE